MLAKNKGINTRLLPFIRFVIIIGLPLLLLTSYLYVSKATPIKANITIDTRKIIGKMPLNWKALAQGGEEQGIRMLENVILPVSALYPHYVRIDHMYDFYNVVSRDNDGNLVFNWKELDATVCDIFHIGAKPFFSLGYMPPAMSSDGSLIGTPKDWNEWTLLVQKTIERYSGQSTRLCDQITGSWLSDIYYEVWNEPDLETFGKWSIYQGPKDYKLLYYYSVMGANRAQNVHHFNIGGPATTAAYRNWFRTFLDYVAYNNLKLDFLSWHHYTKNPDDYAQDLINLNGWLSDEKYTRFRYLPTIISEWGYDSNPNPVSETNIGASHTIASIRNLIEQNLNMAFAFEIKDGLSPSWGILTRDGQKKPRYLALKMLDLLDEYRLGIEGEGTFVRAIASFKKDKITVILVNFDNNNANTELVPLKFKNINPGTYELVTTDLSGKTSVSQIVVSGTDLPRSVLMPPNSVIALELKQIAPN